MKLKAVLILTFVFCAIGGAFSQNTVNSQLFGAGWNNIAPNSSPTQPTPWCPQDSTGAQAKLFSFRLWDDGVKWGQVETTAASPTDTTGYTWTKLDWAMGSNVATKTGCNMKMLYQFGDTPQYLASGVPNNCSDPNTAGCAPPNDVNGDGTGADAWWLNFVGQVALRYSGKTGSKGHMSYWGTWNEADSSNFWCSATGSICFGATGSVKNLILMAWDLKKLTQCIDPTTQVVSPDGHVGSMLNFIHTYSTTSINAPARSITITPPAGSSYSGITCSWGAQTVTGAQTYDVLDEHMRGTQSTNSDPTSVILAYTNAKTEMTNDGLLSKPLWNDEWGYNQGQVANVASSAGYVAISEILMASFTAPSIQQENFYLWDSNNFPLSSTIAGTANDVVAGWLIGATVNPYSVTGSVYSVSGTQSSLAQSGASFKIMFDSSKTCSGSTISTCATANQSAGSFKNYVDIAGVVHPALAGQVPVGFAPIFLTGATSANAPTCSPTGGSFTSTQSTTCSSTSGSAVLCYNFAGNPATNGGSGCTAGSTLYSGAISIGINETLSVVAGGTGFTDSTITSYNFAFQGSAPTFSPVAGSYASTQSVTISQAQSLGICFTTDNSTPTSNGSGSCSHGTLYTGVISVATSETLKAIGMQSGWTDSSVGTASYTIASATMAAAPICSPAGGTFATAQSPTCSTTSAGAVQCWTLDGTTPITNGVSGCTHGTLYSGAISVPTNSTLMVIAGGSTYVDSLVTSYAFVYHGSAPTFSPVAGTYAGAQTVTLTDPQSLAMCVTTDGTNPSSNGAGACVNGTLYTGSLTVSSSQTLKAIGIKSGWTDSGGGTAVYTISGGVMAATPTFSPNGGTFTASQSVTIATTSSGAILCYTTNGSTPATNGTTGCVTGTFYTGPVSVGVNQTLNAVAGGSGFTDSTVGSASFTLQGSAPTFSPVAGTYNSAQTVTLSNAQTLPMCYTTNGSTPTSNGAATCSNGTIYTVPLIIAASETLKAISMQSGWTDSATSSAAYVINYLLSVTVSGLGTVNSSPTGINSCTASTGQCTSLFPQGATVTLSASAGSGYSFAGWSGGGCSGTGTCVATMNSATSVTATFSQIIPQQSVGQSVGVMLN